MPVRINLASKLYAHSPLESSNYNPMQFWSQVLRGWIILLTGVGLTTSYFILNKYCISMPLRLLIYQMGRTEMVMNDSIGKTK